MMTTRVVSQLPLTVYKKRVYYYFRKVSGDKRRYIVVSYDLQPVILQSFVIPVGVDDCQYFFQILIFSINYAFSLGTWGELPH